ncbi:MAG: response regulator [Rubrobacteraceae bacterium]
MLDEVERPIEVAIAEDQRLIKKILAHFVNAQPGMEIVGDARDGEAAVALCLEESPDVILMDISMPGTDGITATRRIRDLSPSTAVLILTAHEDEEYVFEGMRAGALGYLHKGCTPRELADAIRTVHAGDTIVSPAIAEKTLDAFEREEVAHSSLAPSLTGRELEIIRKLAEGRSNKEIARNLYISENTVRNHTANIYKKLQINDRTQAVLCAMREGLLEPYPPRRAR